MSTNTDVDESYDPQERYDNPEYKHDLDEARKQLQQHKEAQRADAAADKQSTRSMIASEDQPDPDAPDLRDIYDVEFRGHTFSFYELGDTAIQAAQFQNADEDDIEEGTEAANFVYETIGAKATDPGATEAYWRQYDFDDVMDLFFDLVEEASDVDEEDVEDIDEFRDE